MKNWSQALTRLAKENDKLKTINAELLVACKSWILAESERTHPCPDLGLKNQYRKTAIELTKQVIIKAEEIK